ncbi:MAG: phosphoserine transaminase [Gammaproteobacteria bacterium]|nr:MAG: phosphoserine transaminase [Gammaproteobacteria bacterium]
MSVQQQKPTIKPKNPHFSSGPCSKRPGWQPTVLANAALGRSHRGQAGRAKLAEVIRLSADILSIPSTYKVGIVPASDTGAMEMALWSLLGPKSVDVFAWDAFSLRWLDDIVRQLKVNHHQYIADYGELADLSQYNPDNDCVFVLNGTSSGVRVPDLDWIADKRQGLTICDATSAVFSQSIDFHKLDVATWSWQKALGGEAAHGMLALSPRAVKRLQTHVPAWPIPKIFRLAENGQLIDEIFQGATINTPSMLCVEDVIDSMHWVQSIGGQAACQAISDKNLAIISAWVKHTAWVEFLAQDPNTRSNTSICLSITDQRFTCLSDRQQRAKINTMCQLLEDNNAAYDIRAYRLAPAGLRIWGGATVQPEDITALLPWLEWAFQQIIAN